MKKLWILMFCMTMVLCGVDYGKADDNEAFLSKNNAIKHNDNSEMRNALYAVELAKCKKQVDEKGR